MSLGRQTSCNNWTKLLTKAEILGQLPRFVFGFLGSLVGRVPTGNTGGANVKAEQPMPIPPDLQRLLNG